MPSDQSSITELIDSMLEEQRVVAATQEADQLLSSSSNATPAAAPISRDEDIASAEQQVQQQPVIPEPEEQTPTVEVFTPSESAAAPSSEAVEAQAQSVVPESEHTTPDSEPVPQHHGEDPVPAGEFVPVYRGSMDPLPEGVGGTQPLAGPDEVGVPAAGTFSPSETEPTPIASPEIEDGGERVSAAPEVERKPEVPIPDGSEPEEKGGAPTPVTEAFSPVEMERVVSSQQFQPPPADRMRSSDPFSMEEVPYVPASDPWSGKDRERDPHSTELELPEPFQTMTNRFAEDLERVGGELAEVVREQISMWASQTVGTMGSAADDSIADAMLLMDRRFAQ